MSLTTDAAQRKASPVCTGFVDYFGDAMVAVAQLSKICNDQHNPGQPLHWAKEKSTDHADCIMRHLIERGTLDVDGVRHSAKVAWRAMALLQIELETAAKVEKPKSMMDTIRQIHDDAEMERVIEKRKAHNADPTTRHGGQPVPSGLQRVDPKTGSWIARESKFGFIVGETVNLRVAPEGVCPGKVVGFTKEKVKVFWDHWTRVDAEPHTWSPSELRHGA